jgi:hypothetical protein
MKHNIMVMCLTLFCSCGKPTPEAVIKVPSSLSNLQKGLIDINEYSIVEIVDMIENINIVNIESTTTKDALEVLFFVMHMAHLKNQEVVEIYLNLDCDIVRMSTIVFPDIYPAVREYEGSKLPFGILYDSISKSKYNL